MAEIPRIKFCGLRRPEDLRLAVELGVDYLGFVFAPASPRALTPTAALELFEQVDCGGARRVGVFQDQPLQFINEVVRRCRLDLVQLHGHEARDAPGAIVVPVVRMVPVWQDEATRPPASPRPLHANVFAVLLDTVTADGRNGGTGIAAAPPAVAAGMRALAPGTRIFLAGGLRPENVAARIETLAPFAVDVSSGIESAPGIKSAERMRHFVAAVRSTA
jgi:phosphoribosylanthranilate isomerase